MAKQRMISTSFWDEDEYIQSLSATETYFFLYLLTNPKVSLCGIYKLLIGHVTLETKLTKEQVIECFEKFQKDGKIIRKDSWIILVNRRKHNVSGSPKITRGIEREMELIPEEIKQLAYDIDKGSIRKSKVRLKSKAKIGSEEVSKFLPDSEEYKISKLLFDLIKANNKTHKFHKLSAEEVETQLEEFCEVADLLFRKDQRDIKFSNFLIEWSQASDFWKANILSMRNFREKFDMLAAQAQRDYNNQNKNKIL